MMRFTQSIGLVLVLLLLQTLVACVTEVSGTLTGELDKEKAVDTSLRAGVAYLRKGDTSNAYRHLQRSLSIEPKSAEVNNAMAMLYRYDKDKENEELFLKKALRYDAKYAPAQNNYGAFLYRHGDYEAALKHLKKAAGDVGYDKRWQSFLNIGYCYTKLTRSIDAEQAFRRAINEKSDHHLPSANLELADILYERSHYVKAAKQLAVFAESAKPSPRSLWLGIRLARILNEKDKLASYELALRKLFPDSEEYEQYKGSMKTAE